MISCSYYCLTRDHVELALVADPPRNHGKLFRRPIVHRTASNRCWTTQPLNWPICRPGEVAAAVPAGPSELTELGQRLELHLHPTAASSTSGSWT